LLYQLSYFGLNNYLKELKTTDNSHLHKQFNYHFRFWEGKGKGKIESSKTFCKIFFQKNKNNLDTLFFA